jgi:hypothetical protein
MTSALRDVADLPCMSCRGRSDCAGWYFVPPYWYVSVWGVWGTASWLASAGNFRAVIDDFGDLVRVSA